MKQADPVMTRQPPEARDYFLACYVVSLVQGETILGKPIRHATIKKYLASAYLLFDKDRLDFQSTHKFVDIILKAVKGYEEVANRRRMITDGMMQWLLVEAARHGPDSPTRAIVDWILLGRYTGFRSSEWCQEHQSKYERIDHWPGQPARAMTRLDFKFLSDLERRLPDKDLNESIIKYLIIKWRIQKNKENGEEITFGDDTESIPYSATRAGYRIYRRSQRLGMKSNEPMAVFRNKQGRVKYITGNMVTTLLRDAASAALGIDRNDPEILLWSTHSIRVTAANLLYRKQLSDQYIMTRLRWKSNAYLIYLRNTIHSANEHSKAASIKLTTTDLQEASYRTLDSFEQIVKECICPPAA
jgi:hypothetical protein